jgi:hypothetical protein
MVATPLWAALTQKPSKLVLQPQSKLGFRLFAVYKTGLGFYERLVSASQLTV